MPYNSVLKKYKMSQNYGWTGLNLSETQLKVEPPCIIKVNIQGVPHNCKLHGVKMAANNYCILEYFLKTCRIILTWLFQQIKVCLQLAVKNLLSNLMKSDLADEISMLNTVVKVKNKTATKQNI